MFSLQVCIGINTTGAMQADLYNPYGFTLVLMVVQVKISSFRSELPSRLGWSHLRARNDQARGSVSTSGLHRRLQPLKGRGMPLEGCLRLMPPGTPCLAAAEYLLCPALPLGLHPAALQQPAGCRQGLCRSGKMHHPSKLLSCWKLPSGHMMPLPSAFCSSNHPMKGVPSFSAHLPPAWVS